MDILKNNIPRSFTEEKTKTSLRVFRSILFIFHFSLFTLSAQSNIVNDTFQGQLTSDEASWRQALAGVVIGRPVTQVESVVAATDGGSLKSYSSRGVPLWDYYARGRLSPHISRSREGTTYICRTNGRLIAINRSGRELWALELGAPLAYPVLIGWDGRLFAFTEGKITCMTAAGYVLWTRMLEKKIAIAPFMDVAGGFIFVQEDGEVLRIDPFGNGYFYRSSAAALPVAAVSVELDEPTVLLLYEDRHMELVYIFAADENESTVSLRGALDLPSPPLAAAAIDASGIRVLGKKDEVAVLLRDGRVVLLSLEKPAILWTAESHVSSGEFDGGTGAPELDLFYDERGVYVLTKTGATGFAPDGGRLWSVRLTAATAVPSFGDDGVLYSGGTDWILYAYRLENRAKTKQSLLYGEAPDGSYGTGTPDLLYGTRYYFSERAAEERLAEIRRAIRNGNVGTREKEYATWLMETAGSLMANPLSLILQPVFAPQRMEAARLLAYIGSRETIPFLTELFNRDPEVLVKAAAAEAIGRIGIDPEGIALRSFERVFYPPFPHNNEILLTAVAAATGALCRFSGPPLSAAGIRLLTILSGDDKPAGTRRRAQIEIRSL
jgi:outer membrane protein assembly factor BamB